MTDAARRVPDQSYLGRVFDSYQNLMQIAACIRSAARQRAIAEPSVLELSRRDTGLIDYLPEVRLTRYPTHQGNQPTLTAPIVLPFADGEFDGCLVTDVYEHIPRELRPELVSEMLRVTDGIVLIGTPQGNELVTRFDRIVFDFIWGKYGERFEPLEQHATYGLERIEDIITSVKALGADKVVALPCNYVYRWIYQILVYFDLQHGSGHSELFEPLNRIYNERISPYDYSEPCYRYLIVMPTNPALNIEEMVSSLGSRETPPAIRETDGMLVEAFRAIEGALSDRLQSANQEISRLNGVISQLQNDNQRAREEIQRLTPAASGPSESARDPRIAGERGDVPTPVAPPGSLRAG
jgi:hypothetical protein